MEVSVLGDWGVVDGATRKQRAKLLENLMTETEVVGNRLKFNPTRMSLTYLAHTPKANFAPNCRTAWGHYFKNRPVEKGTFEFKTDPYKHQGDTFEEIKDRVFYALEWEMGLGKTKTALDVAAYKFLNTQIDMVIVVTDKGVHENWVVREIPAHLAVDPKKVMTAFWNLNRVEAGMRGLIEFEGLSIATMNFSVIHRKKGKAFILKALAERRVLLIIDESDRIAVPSSAQTKALLSFGKLASARLIMTGTPIVNSPLDAWAPFEFLNPAIMGNMKFWQFKQAYSVFQVLQGITHMVWRKDKRTGKSFQAEEPVKIVVGHKNLDELKARIDPHRSRLLKEDCLDLPEKTYRRHPFELPDEYRKAYRSLRDDLIIELEGDRRVTAPLALTKLLRLQQLVCGFVVPEDVGYGDSDLIGEAFSEVNPRMEALGAVCERVQGKALIWAPWRYSLAEIEKFLSEKYGADSVVTYSGATSVNDRRLAIDSFQDPDSPVRWFNGQQQAGGRGLTLTAARDVIYYANTFSYALRLQTEDRAHRIGQTGTVTYTDLEAIATVDGKIIKALLAKQEIASMITGDRLKEWLTT